MAALRLPASLSPSLPAAPPPFRRRSPPQLTLSAASSSTLPNAVAKRKSGKRFLLRSTPTVNLRITKASTSGLSPSSEDDEISKLVTNLKEENDNLNIAFPTKLVIALSIAAAITFVSVYLKSHSSGTSLRLPVFSNTSPQSVKAAQFDGFTLSLFGYRIIIPEQTPGWVYFWLLMAAGCGLFISEEALNVWVGMTLARKLCLDGNWQSLSASFARNSSYIISTVLWVYWGVCISDMIPFYLGRFFRQTKASEDICTKLGIGKEKALQITRVIQKYGNLIGFVERFSLGVRNPTAFLAGAWGTSAECFFTGVCFGGLITLPIQIGIGFLLRERPMVALAGVATVVGIWTIFPYLIVASTTVFLLFRQHKSKSK